VNNLHFTIDNLKLITNSSWKVKSWNITIGLRVTE